MTFRHGLTDFPDMYSGAARPRIRRIVNSIFSSKVVHDSIELHGLWTRNPEAVEYSYRKS